MFRLSKYTYKPIQRMEHVVSYLLWVVEDLGVLLIEYFVFRLVTFQITCTLKAQFASVIKVQLERGTKCSDNPKQH